VGPRAGLDGCGKSRLPPGFDYRTVQPVASRYTGPTSIIIIIIIIIASFKSRSPDGGALH